MAAENPSINIFISYANADEAYKNDLKMFTVQMRRNGDIGTWDDREILPGEIWDKKIKGALNTAHVIILMVSPAFIASDYCFDTEVKRAMERHQDPNDPAVVVPIIARPCDWKTTDFAALQALPRNAKPISKWESKDEAFMSIVEDLRRLIQHLQTKVKDNPPAITSNSTVEKTSNDSPAEIPKPDIKQQLKENMVLVTKDELKKATDNLLALTKEFYIDDYLILANISGNLRDLEKEVLQNTMLPNEARVERNKIRTGLLTCIQLLLKK